MSEKPLAIVGIACRLPGIDTLESLWELLGEGGCRVSPPDAERRALLKLDPSASQREGGFLSQVDLFDASFFGISPREACRMDPAHRLACEVAYEAIEDAGLPLPTLSASPTGVFAGQWMSDYEQLQRQQVAQSDLHCITGTNRASLSGRLSYCFDLKGPCLSLDTSCSSSLVAFHLACQSLRSGEIERALVVGVNLIFASEMTEAFTAAGMLAEDDRCKFGDRRGDGFVRSEGVVAVVLERLDLTRARQGKVWARVCSSAVNHDGADGEYVAPSPLGQMALLQQAYEGRGLSPHSVQYVECHGTGTRIGDGVELRSLGAVLGQGREPANRLRVGSIKTNLGHAEAASGLVGLTKVCLALKHRWLPPSIQFQTPRDDVDWNLLQVQTLGEPWPASGDELRAGVSSFGLTGVNAHVVVAAPPPVASEEVPEGYQLLVLSARSPEALVSLKQRYLEQLQAGQPPLGQVCAAAARQRSHFEYRSFVVAEHLCEAAEALQHPGEARRSLAPDKVAFVFPGQGGQWPAMGRQLYQQQAVFRATFDRCAQAMQPHLVGWQLGELLCADLGDAIDRVQPAIFAIQVSLSALLQAWGILPSAVVGHSMGELAAACVAGRLALEEAARIIAMRSRLLRLHASGTGGMALVELDWQGAASRLQAFNGKLVCAARNSPRATVVAGEFPALQAFVQQLTHQGIFARMIPVDIASHSPAVKPTGELLRKALGPVSWGPGSCDFISSVADMLDQPPPLDADYWVENLVRPVHFQHALEQLRAQGYRYFVEISPHPVLQAAVLETCPEAECLPAMRRDENERRVLLETLGKLYQWGAEVHWPALYPASPPIDLPHYPWQRGSYWLQASSRPYPRQHPLLGSRLASTQGGDLHVFQNELHLDQLPFLAEHRLKGSVVLPAAASLEMVQLAWQCSGWQQQPGIHLSEMRWSEALVIGEVGRRVQLTLRRNGQGASFQLSSAEPSASGPASWTLHASGHILEGHTRRAPAPAPVPTPQADHRLPLAADERYALLQRIGLDYGPNFQGLRQVWRDQRQVLGNIQAPPEFSCILDACLQLLALDERGRLSPRLAVPVGLQDWCLYHPPTVPWPQQLWAVAEHSGNRPQLRILDDQGRVLAELGRMHFREVGPPLSLRRGSLTWGPPIPSPIPTQAATGSWLVFADRGGVAELLKPHMPACHWIYRDQNVALESLPGLGEHPSILYL